MKQFLEIYRPILGDGAQQLEVSSRKIAVAMGMSTSSRFLEFGAHPKASIYRVGGGLATSLFLERDALEDVLGMGINGEIVKPELIWWGHNLPKGNRDTARGRINPHSRPMIQLAEKLDRETGFGTSVDQSLENFVREANPTTSLNGHGFARGGINGLEKRVIYHFKQVGVNLDASDGRIPTFGDVMNARAAFADLVPDIELGPMQFGIVPETSEEINNYGFLA